MACALVVAGLAVAQSPLDGVLSEIDAARAEHGLLLDSFDTERTQFDALLIHIDSLKEHGDDTSVAAEERLQGALREAHEVAQSLQTRRDHLATLSQRIRALEESLVVEIDGQRRGLESRLGTLDAGERSAVLAELRGLTELRERYQQPLPAVPDVALDDILFGLDDFASPDELYAAADELEDNARRLETYLEEVEAHIREVERRNTLVERARSAQQDRALFDEGVNDGRRPSQASSSGASAANGQDSEATGSDTQGSSSRTSDSVENNATVDGSANDDVGTGGGEALAGGTDAEVTSGAAAPGESDGDDLGSASGGGFQDEAPEPADPGTAPPSVDGDGTNDFSPEPDLAPSPSLSPRLTGVGTPTLDPGLTRVAPEGSDSIGGSGSDYDLENLEDDRERTRRQLEEIRRQHRMLLERAEELELEGF